MVFVRVLSLAGCFFIDLFILSSSRMCGFAMPFMYIAARLPIPSTRCMHFQNWGSPLLPTRREKRPPPGLKFGEEACVAQISFVSISPFVSFNTTLRRFL